MKVIRFISLLLSFIFSFTAIAFAEAEHQSCTEPYKCLNYAMEVYRAGKTEEALQLYKDISVRFEDPAVSGISSYMAGSIMAQSDSGGSEEYLEQACSRYPLIGDYALFTLAGIYEKKGDYRKAADLHSKISRTYSDSILRKKSLLKAANLYLASGDTETARKTYEIFISKFHKDKSAPNALYGISISYIMENNLPLAFGNLNKIWTEYPASPVSWPAKRVMNWLKKGGYKPPPPDINDYFIRGEHLFSAGMYEDAAKEYKRFLSYRESFTEGKERDAYFKLSLSYYNARELSDAEDTLKFFIDNYPEDKRSGEIMYSLIRNYLREGKDAPFIKASKAFLRSSKDGEKRAEIIYRLGIYYAEKKDINSAVRYFDRVSREYPGSGFVPDSRWAKGWLLYKERKFNKALTVFDSILKENKNPVFIPFIPKTLYWKAKVFEAMDKTEGMEKNLCQLCRDHKGSFYCFFASHNFDTPCTHSQDPPLPAQEADADKGEGEKWFTGAGYDLKVRLLLYLGFKEEAIEEAHRIKNRLKEDKDRDKALSLSSLLYETGEYNTALQVLNTNFSKEMLYNKGNDLNPGVWRLMYPSGYSSLVTKYAEENGVDPFLLYALIREESWFNKDAVSPAGAIGLMQVMPKTASLTMNDAGIDRDSMFDPELNISIGARFFSELMKRFDGNAIFAIASYNAGPNAVTKWLKERSEFGLDEFIEDIPYKETRNYVKKVFSSYNEYQHINNMSTATSGTTSQVTFKPPSQD